VQTSVVSPQAGVISPWRRIGLPTGMFLLAVLQVLTTGFSHFEWLPWFCMGCVFALGAPRQRGEPFGTRFKSPRAMASGLLLVAAVVGFGYDLFVLYTKYFSH